MIDELKKQVFGRQTFLKKIFEDSGKMSVFDYVNSRPVAAASQMSLSFYKETENLLAGLYPQELVKEACAQLRNFPLVSTIDHHGILNHPFFINSNLIFSLKKGQKYLICLSTSGVSLNNSSWPGCLVINDENQNIKRFSFFPDRKKMQTVFSAEPITAGGVNKVLKEIGHSSGLSSIQKQKLNLLVSEVFEQKEILSKENFSGQASLISSLLWSKIFPDAPKVLYLPVEDLVSNILENFICDDSANILHRLLFTQEGWRLVERYFAGSLGAFSSEHKGSFLFWGVNDKGRRVHLQRSGGVMEGLAYSLSLRPKEVKEALKKRRLYPSTLVCFLVLLYSQITCLGGFNQVNWLTEIKQNFLKLLAELGEVKLAEKIKLVPADNFAEGNLAFLPRNGQIIKAAGVDIYLTGTDLYPKYRQLAQSLMLAQSIESLLPEIYRVIVPAEQRKLKLLGITDQIIARQNGAAEKISRIFN